MGATGSLDAASLSIARLNDTGSIAIQPSVHSGVVTVRYNVTAVDGIHNPFSGDDTVCLWASVRANSAAARVHLRLIEVPWAPNPNVVLGEIDSRAGFNDTEYTSFKTVRFISRARRRGFRPSASSFAPISSRLN